MYFIPDDHSQNGHFLFIMHLFGNSYCGSKPFPYSIWSGSLGSIGHTSFQDVRNSKDCTSLGSGSEGVSGIWAVLLYGSVTSLTSLSLGFLIFEMRLIIVFDFLVSSVD
jgi:hypothetical protein